MLNIYDFLNLGFLFSMLRSNFPTQLHYYRRRIPRQIKKHIQFHLEDINKNYTLNCHNRLCISLYTLNHCITNFLS